uniref:Multivesicular body subunit 12A n=1 Tax=Syphacia muris TaxID=451379 RepID=A0A0N5ALZ3_9BILA
LIIICIFITFIKITRAYDDQSDADLWKEGGLTAFWSRPVRYIAVSRDTPANSVGAHVVIDLCITKESDPVPRGFTAIDYTADSREKSLRKRCLCVRTVPRDTVVDAVGEIIVLNKMKRPPNNFSSAGEVDGALICFRHVVVPPSFGVLIPDPKPLLAMHSMDFSKTIFRSNSIYPSIDSKGTQNTDKRQCENDMKGTLGVNALTIRAGDIRKNIKDVPFKLHPLIENGLVTDGVHSLPEIMDYSREKLDTLYNYEFTLERDVVRNL